jgi:hypothetical protein
MEPLIDLSTPKVPAKTYSADFTPALSKALGECFKRRKQSLLPVAKENELQTIREVKQQPADLSAIQEGNTTTGSNGQPANLTMGFSPADKLMNLDTPQSNLSRPGEWFDSSFLNNNANNLVEKENNTMETSTPQKAPASSSTSRKRPPSTPLTPSLFKDATINKKKRALNHKDSNVICSSPSKLTSFWNESDKHRTPDSVIQMRRLIRSSHPNEQPQEQDNANPGSCDDKRLHENPLDEVLYSKWLTEQHLHELQTVVEFMELEKRFAL